jgi:hypothetical protein
MEKPWQIFAGVFLMRADFFAKKNHFTFYFCEMVFIGSAESNGTYFTCFSICSTKVNRIFFIFISPLRSDTFIFMDKGVFHNVAENGNKWNENENND